MTCVYDWERAVDKLGEVEIVGASKDGSVLDCGDAAGPGLVGAALIRRVCYEFADQLDPRGVWLRKAAFTGSLDLTGMDVPFPLRFEDCEFESPLILEGAQLYEHRVTGCALPGLLANGVRIRRDLDLPAPMSTGRCGPAPARQSSSDLAVRVGDRRSAAVRGYGH